MCTVRWFKLNHLSICILEFLGGLSLKFKFKFKVKMTYLGTYFYIWEDFKIL